MNTEIVKEPVYNTDIGARILVECAFFLGLSQLGSNQDIVREEIKAEYIRRGWKHQWPESMSLVECVWRRGYTGRVELADVKNIFHPSAVTTFHKAADEGWVSPTPEIGAIGIVKFGESADGAAFLVKAVAETIVYGVESLNGPRQMCESLAFKPTTSRHLLGFIIPPKYV